MIVALWGTAFVLIERSEEMLEPADGFAAPGNFGFSDYGAPDPEFFPV